jgi:hypothetical protein
MQPESHVARRMDGSGLPTATLEVDLEPAGGTTGKSKGTVIANAAMESLDGSLAGAEWTPRWLTIPMNIEKGTKNFTAAINHSE